MVWETDVMINELRGVSFEDLKQIELFEGEIIGVGSEGCVHDCMRKVSQLMGVVEKKLSHEISYRIVTPRIPEKYMVSMLNLLSEIASQVKINSIVVNDYGLLYYLNKNCIMYGDIILGRTLIRTLADVPWNNLFLETESLEMRESMLQANIMHLEKIELFKKCNVKGVELSPVKVNENIMANLQKMGLQCYVHYNSEIATIGRTCPRLRMRKSKAEGCVLDCDESIELEFSQPYSLTKIDSKSASVYPVLYNINNAIYHKGNVFDNFDYLRSNGIIFDYRLCASKDINEKRIKIVN